MLIFSPLNIWAKHSGIKVNIFTQKYLPECFAPTMLINIFAHKAYARAKHSGNKVNIFSRKYPPECFAPTRFYLSAKPCRFHRINLRPNSPEFAPQNPWHQQDYILYLYRSKRDRQYPNVPKEFCLQIASGIGRQ